MTSSKGSDLKGTMEEDIFLLVNYKKKSNYIKVCFKYNDEYHLVMVREAISAAYGNIYIEDCDFYWEDVLINENDLIPLIKAKKGCGHFKLNVKIPPGSIEFEEESDVSDNDTGTRATTTTLQPEDDAYKKGDLNVVKFKEYINADIMTRVLLRKDPTEPSVRRSIIDVAVKYLFQECGSLPNSVQKDSMMRIICELFRPLSSDAGLVYKWLQDKIKNVRVKIRQGASLNKTGCLLGKRSAEGEIVRSNRNIDKQLEYLQCLDDCDDIPKIEAALHDTLRNRIDQYGRSDFSVFNTYKFFSKSLHLISYDFSIRFPSVQENVIELFESFLDAACNIHKAEKKQNLPEEDYLLDIRKLLTICHYTKSPTAPRTPSFTISQMMDDFITFSTEDEDKKPEFKDHPILLAQGSSKKEIWKYFLQVGDVLLELPQETEFLGAFDYLLKSYYVFNVEFPRSIGIFLNFIMVNIYKVNIKSKYDQKKPLIDDLHTRSRELLGKIRKYLQIT